LSCLVQIVAKAPNLIQIRDRPISFFDTDIFKDKTRQNNLFSRIQSNQTLIKGERNI